MQTSGLGLDAQNVKTSNQRNSKKRALYWIAKICFIIAVYSLFTVLFNRQAMEYDGRYRSDLPWHIRYGIDGGDYSLLYFAIGIIYRLWRSFLPIALFESAIVVFTFLLAEWYIHKHFEISIGWSTWISAGMLFLSSIYIPLLYPYYYKWSLISQPWHNITYFGMRLFSIPAFFYTLRVLERYRNRFTWKDWLCLAIPLMLGASIKPNFLAGYSLALLCVLIADFAGDCFRRELTVSSFFRYVSLGSVVFPAVIILFYQMVILYGAQDDAASESGIAIVFWTSRFLSQGKMNAVIEILRDIAFPLLMIAYGCKRLSKEDKFVWLVFLITLVQSVILAETGPRSGDGNFEWGVFNAGYLMFLYMVPRFVQLVRMVPWKQKDLRDKCFALAGSGMLCAHLLCGVKYFFVMLSGGWFFI